MRGNWQEEYRCKACDHKFTAPLGDGAKHCPRCKSPKIQVKAVLAPERWERWAS